MSELPGTQQRDVIKDISPPWLSKGTNERYMYNFGLANDALLEKMNQAMRAHMPGLCTPTALPYIGKDRIMTQGPAESNDSFSDRLSRAFDAWQHAGSRQAVMSQALIYVDQFAVVDTDQVPRCVTVSTSAAGTWATWDTYYNTSNINEAPAHVSITPSNWNWDNHYLWWRAWLILFFDPASTLGPAPAFGEPSVTIGGNSNICIGLNITSSFFVTLRALIRLWKSANTYYPWFIISFNAGAGGVGDEYSPNSVLGTGNPNGTYGRFGHTVAGVYVAARPNDNRFVDGTGIYQSCSIHTGT